MTREYRAVKKKILLIANGVMPEQSLINKLVKWADLIVAVDGGANHCVKLNLTPDFIVGDLDSVTIENQDRFHKSEIVYLPDQNKHDFEKAFEFIETLDPKEVRVIASWGKRFDHTLANLYVILSKQTTFRTLFYDNEGILTSIDKENVLADAVGETISLFSFGPLFGLSMKGFKFSNIQPDYPDGFIGLSNVITENPAIIRLNKGQLLLYRVYAKD
jgi:thiamine pyrophosphokinase